MKQHLSVILLTSLVWGGSARAGEVRFEGEGHAYHPVWSLDGRYLAYEVNRYAGDVDLYISPITGDAAQDGVKVSLPGGANVFGGSGQVVVNPVWHRDGYVVFEGSNQGGQFRIYYRKDSGGVAAELIPATELPGDLTFPAVSPNGRTMSFISDETGAGDLRARDTQTSDLTQLTRTSTAEMFPSFSRDGSKILFTRKKNGGEDVFELAVSTSAETQLVGGSGDQTRPAYTDGGVVFFDGSRGDDHWDLVASGPDGKKTLARDVRLPLRARPAVSPDGRWVAYTLSDPTQADKVVLARVDGSQTVDVVSEFTACGEPALGMQGDKLVLAYTALPRSGSDWRFLYLVDVSDRI